MDLVLAPGITGLLGPNGAGKTTMLRILATALAADRGSMRILGEDPTTTDGRVAVRRRLGYVPQETGFPRGFTAFAFVDYMAILKEWTDLPSRHDEVRRVIDLVGLTEVATKRVSALSGGQRRRVVLAQALLGSPDLLVLDEPTAGLDPAQRGRLRDVLGRAGETSTVVISTHQTEDVAALCERVVVLDGGRVLFDGTVTDMVGQAAGRVWMAAERDPAAQHAWRTGSGRFRNVGDPPPSAELIEPALEDAYLLLVGDAAARHRAGGRVMSAAISPRPEAPTAEGWPALRALARVEAKRFARHPLFLLGIAIMLIPMVAVVWQQELDANPMTGTLFIAFLIGVFGFIVAHRLTTSLLRTRDLADDHTRGSAAAHAGPVPGLSGSRHRRGGGGGLHAGHRGHLDAGRRPGQPRTSPGSGTTLPSTCWPPSSRWGRSPRWADRCSGWPWRGGRRSGGRP